MSEYDSRYYAKNRDRIIARTKLYAKNNPQKVAECKRIWASNNRERIRAQKKLRYRENVLHRIAHVLRDRIRESLQVRGWNKRNSTRVLLGADLATTRAWIESKFKPGMTWENHGEWHIDHRVPLCTAKTEAELLPLFHFQNLQPLWAADNLKKARSVHVVSS